MSAPRMFYFGPWDRPGHYLFSEHGQKVYRSAELATFPARWRDGYGIDCRLQPGCRQTREGYWDYGEQNEGEALVHHVDGWTALAFWDRSVDRRGGCNSTYFAEGTFTFEEMVEMARARFAARWKRMEFSVRLADDKGRL